MLYRDNGTENGKLLHYRRVYIKEIVGIEGIGFTGSIHRDYIPY